MSYDIDEFVNSNAVNVEFNQEAFNNDEELVFEMFQKMVDFDDTNDNAYPVIVLVKNTNVVAWYDLEMFCGFINVA